jgi:hypothetical protein
VKRACGCPEVEDRVCDKPLWMHLGLAKRDPFRGTFGHPEWARPLRGRRRTGYSPVCFYCAAFVSDRGLHYRTHAIPGARFAVLGAYAEILADL